jgi:hypothetical protein
MEIYVPLIFGIQEGVVDSLASCVYQSHHNCKVPARKLSTIHTTFSNNISQSEEHPVSSVTGGMMQVEGRPSLAP